MRGDIPPAAFRVLTQSRVTTHEPRREFTTTKHFHMSEYMKQYRQKKDKGRKR